MSRFVIVAFLPKELNDLINPIREQFEPGVTVRIPPHVTVVPPFYTDKEIILYDNIKNSLSATVSFKAVISEVKSFDKENGKKVGYFSIIDQDNFKKLNQLINSNLSAQIRFDTRQYPDNDLPQYIPHITFAMDISDKDIETVKNNSKNIKSREFTIDRLSLLTNEQSGGIWKVERIYFLH